MTSDLVLQGQSIQDNLSLRPSSMIAELWCQYNWNRAATPWSASKPKQQPARHWSAICPTYTISQCISLYKIKFPNRFFLQKNRGNWWCIILVDSISVCWLPKYRPLIYIHSSLTNTNVVGYITYNVFSLESALWPVYILSRPTRQKVWMNKYVMCTCNGW